MHVNHADFLITRLKEHHVHVTQNRITVFRLLTESKSALSVSLIMKRSEILLDRISVHRALQYFLKKGMVEIIPTNNGSASYILSTVAHKTERNSNGGSVFFVCSSCRHTEAIMKPLHIRPANLTNHQVKKCSLILEGLCNKCK
jgi:Fe2+ or Zn2+ uptake regulation protein